MTSHGSRHVLRCRWLGVECSVSTRPISTVSVRTPSPDYCGAGMDGGSAVARQRMPVSVAPIMKAMQLGLYGTWSLAGHGAGAARTQSPAGAARFGRDVEVFEAGARCTAQCRCRDTPRRLTDAVSAAGASMTTRWPCSIQSAPPATATRITDDVELQHCQSLSAAYAATTSHPLVQNGISDQASGMNARIGKQPQQRQRNRLDHTFSGSRVASQPRTVQATSIVAVQPYQYMAGPSPLRPGAQPKSTRLVAGW